MITNKKFVFYLDNVNRGIVISEKNEETIDELSKKVSEQLSKVCVCEFGNDKDRLIVRSSRILAVHIQNTGSVGRPPKSEKVIKKTLSSAETDELLLDDKDIESLNLVVPDLDLGELQEEKEYDHKDDEILKEVDEWHKEVDEENGDQK